MVFREGSRFFAKAMEDALNRFLEAANVFGSQIIVQVTGA